MNAQKSLADVKMYAAANKWFVALLAGLLFMLVSSPFLYRQTDNLARMISPKLSLASFSGVPNLYGIALHSLVFALIVRLLMV